MIRLDSRTEGAIAIMAAFLVLFSAMLDPFVSLVLAAASLAGLGIYRLVKA